MLNITASMAVALRHLHRGADSAEGGPWPRPRIGRGALGTHGALWLSEHAASAVKADYVITKTQGESPSRRPAGESMCQSQSARRAAAGAASVQPRRRPRFRAAAHGQRLGHGGRRRRATRRLQGAGDDHDAWRRFVSKMAMPKSMAEALLDPGSIDAVPSVAPRISALPPHAHDDRTHDRPQRHELATRTGSISTSTCAPCPARAKPRSGRCLRGRGRPRRRILLDRRSSERVGGRHAALGRARRHGETLPPSHTRSLL